jgi:transcriptional regulator with XRE-family HTH domain
MSPKNNYISFGDCIKKLRKTEGLPLRKVAAGLDIDPSTLGKFEKNNRWPSKEIIKSLSEIFKTDSKELIISSLSDRLEYELRNEEYKYEILKATEYKLKKIK